MKTRLGSSDHVRGMSGGGPAPEVEPGGVLNERVDTANLEEETTTEPALGRVCGLAAVIASAAVLGILGLVVADVALRFTLNRPISGTIEYVAFWLMLPATVFGIVVTQRRDEHIDVPLLVGRLGAQTQYSLTLLARLGFLLLALLLFWFGTTGALERGLSGESAGSSGVEIAPTRWFIPVAAALLVIQLSREIITLIRSASDDVRAAHVVSWHAVVVVASQVAGVVLLHQPFLPEVKGAIVLAMMVILLLVKVPVAAAMALPGAAGVWAMTGTTALERTLIDVPFTAAASWSLSVLPMFVFMGLMLWSSGATYRLYNAARLWLGWLPGGLAVTTVASGAGLSAASGSTVGITYALSRIGMPEMFKNSYDRRVTLGSILTSGMAGQLIPPSVLLVVYAGIAQVPVGPQLLAGIIPGILLAFSACVAIVLAAAAFPGLAPRSPVTATWSERFRAVLAALPVPVLSLLVVGGLLVGVFTATEAGAFGALGAIVVAATLIRDPRVFGRSFTTALVGTVSSVGQIMFLLLGTAVMTRTIALSGLPALMVRWVNDLGLGRVTFLLLLIVVFLALGAFLDPIAMMLLTVPFLMPVLVTLEVDLIWFGVFVVLLAELAMVTPPVGILVFIVHKLAQNPTISGGVRIGLGHAFAAAAWVLPVAIGVLVLLIAFPGITNILGAE
ncbi:TRAP transporter large permease subunit [Aeromicrobium sp. CTD01-1L150]|uniref:TRAP transporter large permease n=1 Tax=Aeromicrobium sp. CTD01-1L150 TaxID=3341830 RepID=UPI0035C163BA